MRQLNLAGRKLGRLLAIEKVGIRDGKILWRCLCDCGQETTRLGSELKRHNKGCNSGCSRRLRLIGQKFGHLTIAAYSGTDKNGQSLWETRCSCGGITVVRGQDLKNGNTKSCGCRSRGFKHGLSHTKAYQIWMGAKGHAKTKKYPFTITIEDVQRLINITPRCPLLDIPLDTNASFKADNLPSLDRTDTLKGYTLDNIWIISWRANRIKNNLTLEELKMFTRRLEEKVRSLTH